MQHRILRSLSLAILAVAILLFSSCKTSLRYASVHIAEVLPPVGAQTLYIAISPNYWIKDSFLTNAVILPPSGSYTDITIANIAWDTDDNDESGDTRDFWLIAAEDLDVNGEFGPGDRYIPFSRVTLTNGETLEIKTIDMTNPIQYNLDQQQHIMSIQHSDPSAINKNHKVYLQVDAMQYTFADPLLCKEFILWNNGFTNALFFWDKDGDLVLSQGDYRTITYTGGFPLDYSTYLLSPFMLEL